MSIKSAIALAGIGIVGLGALLSVLPGSPVSRLFNPPVTVGLPGDAGPDAVRQLAIVTLLPRDAIPAIKEQDLLFLSGAEADAQMDPANVVIGLSIDGDHRAYSTAHLSSHEIVNDTVGGEPVAMTW
jgi:hypothetical protein